MKKKKLPKKYKRQIGCLILLVPAAIVAATLGMLLFMLFNSVPVMDTLKEAPNRIIEMEVPEENIPLYKEAAEDYNIPWTLLAAHHRIETRFSTMDPLLSPVGAEGHLQFMPCTFVGWSHPTCSGQGQGEISEEDKTNLDVIAYYGGYGVDGNGDGIADPYNLTDALYSAANYLSQNGAAEGDLERAIFQYNHSDKYVADVLHYYNLYEEKYN
ncbi:lytic transglycosylase domain-containing protein [Planococcus sp. CPCC 101016]|uniref:lytic transglycosylase domain-containing protein n=1 Tax=Planococcus sp. CPCC 101016 TaxID=2599617 RepID=UPI0011B5BF87|nr:lytic transglycosylase domain-containing protein [Planococcus sp. CPCC 101016]TWT08122.1 lytic transglycosylase domain-containing protein [Planococcus sp. CPCC 101016]